MAIITLEGKEIRRADAFMKKHKKCRLKATAGGKFFYTIVPSGIGTDISIGCGVCNKWKYITDIDDW